MYARSPFHYEENKNLFGELGEGEGKSLMQVFINIDEVLNALLVVQVKFPGQIRFIPGCYERQRKRLLGLC